MSLIHDALKSIDEPAYVSREPVVHASTAGPALRPAWMYALLACAAVTGAGGLAWYLWQAQAHGGFNPALLGAAPPPAAVAPAPLGLAQAQAYVPVSAAASYISAPEAEVAMHAHHHAPASLAIGPDAVARAPAAPTVDVSIEKAARKPVVPRDVVRKMPPVRVAKAVATAAPVEPVVPVEQLFSRFVAAMRDGQTQDAEQALTALGKQLPAGSLGLLRAQAWFDLQAGRDQSAAAIYGRILERLPGDEEAAINLASIQSRQQQPEEARATLDASLRLQPDSAGLRAALAQFNPNARP